MYIFGDIISGQSYMISQVTLYPINVAIHHQFVHLKLMWISWSLVISGNLNFEKHKSQTSSRYHLYLGQGRVADFPASLETV